jgi:RNA polymerase sigma factor (sigma-70 family)
MITGQKSAPATIRGTPGGGAVEEEVSDEQLLQQFERDQNGASFAELVRRHGSMVLAVCRRVLRHTQDAEDAFQATFLVLVHKAGSLKNPNLLSSWLHGVAYRAAQHARAAAARRYQHEREAASMVAAAAESDPSWQERLDCLDEELQRLPEFYRAPLVLCYLEGKTNVEAAEILGWPTGSMSARLARAREMLHQRLTRRNSALFGLLLLPVLDHEVPATLLQTTMRSAAELIAGKSLAAISVSPAVSTLTRASLGHWATPRWRWLLPLLLALGLAVLGASAAAFTVGDPPPTNEPSTPGTQSDNNQNRLNGGPSPHRCQSSH